MSFPKACGGNCGGGNKVTGMGVQQGLSMGTRNVYPSGGSAFPSGCGNKSCNGCSPCGGCGGCGKDNNHKNDCENKKEHEGEFRIVSKCKPFKCGKKNCNDCCDTSSESQTDCSTTETESSCTESEPCPKKKKHHKKSKDTKLACGWAFLEWKNCDGCVLRTRLVSAADTCAFEKQLHKLAYKFTSLFNNAITGTSPISTLDIFQLCIFKDPSTLLVPALPVTPIPAGALPLAVTLVGVNNVINYLNALFLAVATTAGLVSYKANPLICYRLIDNDLADVTLTLTFNATGIPLPNLVLTLFGQYHVVDCGKCTPKLDWGWLTVVSNAAP